MLSLCMSRACLAKIILASAKDMRSYLLRRGDVADIAIARSAGVVVAVPRVGKHELGCWHTKTLEALHAVLDHRESSVCIEARRARWVGVAAAIRAGWACVCTCWRVVSFRPAALHKNASLFEFSMCLSRACLGNIAQKKAFFAPFCFRPSSIHSSLKPSRRRIFRCP